MEQRIRELFPGQDYKVSQVPEQSREHRVESCPEPCFREVWYIGDQYECDIVGAAGAGLFPIWYTGAMDMPYVPHEGVLTVEDWEEVRAVLEEAER